MNPYSVDLRQRIVERYLAGGVTRARVAEEFSVSERTVSEYLRLLRETKSLEPKPHAGGPAPKLDEAARAKLKRRVEDDPDITLEALREDIGGLVSVPTLCKILLSMGARVKKNGPRQ